MDKTMSMQDRPLVVLGEALLDLLVPRPGVPLAEAEALHPRLGGAPANVAVQAARLGAPVELLTAVGDDPFADRLLGELGREGVNHGHVVRRQGHRTGLTFVQVDEDAERHFFPWRDNAADQTLAAREVPAAVVQGASLFHRGTVSLCAPAVREATRAAVARARDAEVPVSLDVNLRFGMFKDRDELIALAQEAVRTADVVKATVEEAHVLCGPVTEQDVIDRWLADGVRLVMLTRGPDGAVLATPNTQVEVPAPAVRVVDATGAGDAFVGAMLAQLRRHGSLDVDATQLETMGRFACECGAAAVTALGATTAMKRAALPPV